MSSHSVWLNVDDEDAWVIATVGEKFGGSVMLKRTSAPKGVELETSVSEEAFAKLSPATGDPNKSVADLVWMPDVNTGAVLHNLRLRYAANDIYTAIGPILIAVNPYKMLECCSAETLASMMEEEDVEKLPPHVFKIAKAAYASMCRTGGAQSVLISGESGAGKTETTKLCMSCLAEISGSSGKSTESALESGILLEAFGNAKTVHNNNSSRFGKWCSVHFDEAGHIAACKVRSYLLEKSRVVTPGDAERNYHIFYQMLKGATDDERKEYQLMANCSDYAYCGKTFEVEVTPTPKLPDGRKPSLMGWDVRPRPGLQLSLRVHPLSLPQHPTAAAAAADRARAPPRSRVTPRPSPPPRRSTASTTSPSGRTR